LERAFVPNDINSPTRESPILAPIFTIFLSYFNLQIEIHVLAIFLQLTSWLLLFSVNFVVSTFQIAVSGQTQGFEIVPGAVRTENFDPWSDLAPVFEIRGS
jgi:hypothetical protein